MKPVLPTPSAATEDLTIDLADRIDQAAVEEDHQHLLRLNEECADRIQRSTSPEIASSLWYYRANIQAALGSAQELNPWSWRQPHAEREILYLRRARNEAKRGEQHPLIHAQIATNLANALNRLGRSIDALELFDLALVEVPHFAMALANRGNARSEFAKHLHDEGHMGLLLAHAHGDLTEAAGPHAVWDSEYAGLRERFVEAAHEIAAHVSLKYFRDVDLDNHSLGRTHRERVYRQWALEHQLFVNPLNVLGRKPIAATDAFVLPSHGASMKEPPHYIAWFNLLKQEFAAARLFLFEAETDGAHFADNELMLIDTLDNPAFGISLEKMRVAFRVAYGLLDKVAGFVNAYFKLGIPPGRVSLRHIWYEKDGQTIRPDFAELQNWPLRGLYWLAFDIVGTVPSDPDAISPDAIQINKLRNALEHRCLILREVDGEHPSDILQACSVTVFRERTFSIMRLARASLMYLSLAVGREEKMRAESKKGLTMPMSLPLYRGRNHC